MGGSTKGRPPPKQAKPLNKEQKKAFIALAKLAGIEKGMPGKLLRIQVVIVATTHYVFKLLPLLIF
jgi:hypothetical protein